MGNNYCSLTAVQMINQCVCNQITSILRHNPAARVIDLTYSQDGRVLLIQSGESAWFRLSMARARRRDCRQDHRENLVCPWRRMGKTPVR